MPWQVMASQLMYFNNVFFYTPVYGNLIEYERSLVTDLYEELGWNDDGSFGDKLLRMMVLDLACASRMDDCVKTAKDKFAAWMDGGEFIAPNLREIVYK